MYDVGFDLLYELSALVVAFYVGDGVELSDHCGKFGEFDG